MVVGALAAPFTVGASLIPAVVGGFAGAGVANYAASHKCDCK